MKMIARLAVLLVLLADWAAFGTRTGRAHWIDEALGLAFLFVFGLVFILVILIPRWRRFEPKIYLETFAAFLPLAAPLLPLLGASEFAITLGALDRQWHEPGAPLSLCVAIVGILGVLVPSVVINVPINMKVLRRPDSLSVSEIVDQRKKWAIGHAARTGFALVALLALFAARSRWAH
jgi:Domain of unknown function (DUF1772)